MSFKKLVYLSIGLALLLLVPTAFVELETLDHLGSWIAGGGSILAVLWFSSSLQTQAEQLREQRVQLGEQQRQFLAQFHHQQQATKREALVFAEGLLNKALATAIEKMPGTTIIDLPMAYGQAGKLMTPVLTERDPAKVQQIFEQWLPAELAAGHLLKGIKQAAEVYFTAINASGFDFSMEAEEFLPTYKDQLIPLPVFDQYIGPCLLLAAMVSAYTPGRKTMMLSYMCAAALNLPQGFIRNTSLDKEVAKHEAAGYPISPVIKQYKDEQAANP